MLILIKKERAPNTFSGPDILLSDGAYCEIGRKDSLRHMFHVTGKMDGATVRGSGFFLGKHSCRGSTRLKTGRAIGCIISPR